VLHSGVTRVSFSAHCRPVADSADITDGLEITIQGSWPGISARVLGRAWSKKLLAGGLERDEARIGRQTGLEILRNSGDHRADDFNYSAQLQTALLTMSPQIQRRNGRCGSAPYEKHYFAFHSWSGKI
jgi:hypothetical protein